MKTHVASKTIAASLLGLLLGIVIHNYRYNLNKLGRESYVARSADEFDRSFAILPSLGLDILKCIILAGFVFAIYELIVLAISAIFKKTRGEAK